MPLINLPQINFVDPLDQQLVQGDGRSTYKLAHVEKSAGRLAWEFWASHVLLLVVHPDFDLMNLREWRVAPCGKGSKTNSKKLDELRRKHPDLADRIDTEIEAIDLRP